jgi:hypothetical protein
MSRSLSYVWADLAPAPVLRSPWAARVTPDTRKKLASAGLVGTPSALICRHDLGYCPARYLIILAKRFDIRDIRIRDPKRRTRF